MYNLLLQAYFDLHGSFEKIDQVPFYSLLEAEAEKEELALEDFCYSELGYGRNGKKAFQKRKELALQGKSITGKKDIDIPAFVKKKISVSQESDSIIALSNFIENTDLLVIRDKKGNSCSLRQLFVKLKCAGNEKILNQMAEQYIPLVAPMLKSAKSDEKEKNAYICAGTIFLPHEVDVLETSYEVCLQIGRRSQQMYAAHFYYVVKNLLGYAIPVKKKNSAYLAFVDIANIYDCTIAELIQFMGFHYRNQFDIYSRIGYFVFPLGNETYWIVDPFHEQKNQTIGVADLRKIYQNATGGK